MDTKQLLALDIGAARTGIARASAVARLPEPLETVETGKLLPRLEEIIKQQPTGLIVVGLPRSLEGKDTKQTQWVRSWVTDAKDRIDLPFYYQDEALTTHLAEAQAAAHKKPADADSLAAAIILQDFLDTPEPERVIC